MERVPSVEEIADLCYENTASAGAASPLQNPKTRLLEVTVERQRVGQAFALHDDERDAVDESPILVRPRLIERESLAEDRRRQMNDVNVIRRQKVFNEIGGLTAKVPRQPVSNFQ